MPDLQHIDTRVQNDPAWAATRDANLPTAQNWARKVSIVHVLGTDPLAFWNQPWPLTLHPTENTNSRTAQSEDAFGLGRSLYFYAGRAYPRTGGTAFAFGPGSEQGHTGSATPFDTGGLYADAPYAPPISMSPPDNLQRRISLCAASIIPLKDWRPAFAAFLAAYFAPPAAVLAR